MKEVTDEMLMALVDHELDPETALDVARAAQADPQLAQRLDAFVRTRQLAKQSLADVLEEAVPQRLLAAARLPAPSNFSSRWGTWIPAVSALAAGLAGLLLVYGIFRAQVSTPHGFLDPGELALVLDRQKSGTRTSLADGGTLEPTATYRTADGFCRTFRLASAREAAAAWAGIACRREGTWQIEMVVAKRTGEGGSVTPASDHVTESLDAFLDRLGAEGSLDAAAESDLIEYGWRVPPSGTLN